MTGYGALFKALGDEVRLRLLNLLLQTGEKVYVCEMVDALQLPQYQVSRQLSLLKKGGLVLSTRSTTWIGYELTQNDSHFMKELFSSLKKELSRAFPQDLKNLKERLALRSKGVCVLGCSKEMGKKKNNREVP